MTTGNPSSASLWSGRVLTALGASPEVTPAGDVGPDRAGRPEVLCVNHVGLAARDPARLAEFYRDVLGLEIVGGSPATNEFGATAFLKGRASQESHQLVFFASPQFRHTAFRVETLNDLRRFHRLIRDRGVPIEASFNHGASLAFYFRDLEENLIEIYWDTGARNHQPYGDPPDLTQPEQALLQEVAAIAGPGTPAS